MTIVFLAKDLIWWGRCWLQDVEKQRERRKTKAKEGRKKKEEETRKQQKKKHTFLVGGFSWPALSIKLEKN